MAEPLHPEATHHLPSFITAPGDTDVLMTVTAIFMAGAVVAFGLLFLRLHTMPERMAHKSHKVQFEIVAVLGLIALFTHEHIFWIAGLLLAFIDIPNFGHPLQRIAGSVEKMAGFQPGEGMVKLPDQPEDDHEAHEAPPDKKNGGEAAPRASKPTSVSKKELDHA